MQQKHRPLGVMIIAILTIMGGKGFLASGIAVVVVVVAPFLSDMAGLSAGIGAALATLVLDILLWLIVYGKEKDRLGL